MTDSDSSVRSATERFEEIYRVGPAWEIDGPQPEIIALANKGAIRGRVLDAGCGSGHNALFLAARGLAVTAFDFIAAPLEIARQRSRDSGIAVDWRLLDALKLDGLEETFDTVVDSGLMHVFPSDVRARYIDGLASVLALDGVVHVICFSDRQPGNEGPLRISRAELHRDFSPPWEIVELTETRYACRLIDGGPQHDGAGAHACRASIVRHFPVGK